MLAFGFRSGCLWMWANPVSNDFHCFSNLEPYAAMLYTIYPEIQGWLRSLGYEVSGRPIATLEAAFHREARQWGITPFELADLIRDEDRPVGLPEATFEEVQLQRIAA